MVGWLCTLCVWSAAGQSRAEQLLLQMKQAVETMAAYETAFVVEAEGMTFEGTMAVEDARYRIRMGEVEVLGDAAMRHEINHARREVTLMPSEQMSTNLLSNPASALLAVARAEAELLTEQNGTAELLLVPQNEAGQIRLWLDTTKGLPMKIRYEQEGVGVDIRIRSMHPLKGTIPAYDVARYEGYEIIDFR